MKRKILAMLRENGEYVSGQQICEALGVSRTAVWKTIGLLKDEGYVIHSVPNRGYQLAEAPDVLTEAEVGSQRSGAWRDAPLEVYQVTDSTNIQANRLAEEGAPEGTLVVADRQEGGRGRRGRSWETPAGESLAMSFILRPAFSPGVASMLTLLAALAGKRAVEEMCGTAPQIKWPNDLLLGGKKITGILTEMKLEEQEIRQVVVGIGFNVTQKAFRGELRDKATSILLATGKHISRAALCCRVMDHFETMYKTFSREQNVGFVLQEYNQSLISLNREVRILEPGHEWSGCCRGMDDFGALLVEDSQGKLNRIVAGEVSVRGMQGYV